MTQTLEAAIIGEIKQAREKIAASGALSSAVKTTVP